MNCCVDNEIYFLFLALSAPGLPAPAWNCPRRRNCSGVSCVWFSKKFRPILDLSIEETSEEPYSLFTWKINQAERLNNIIQANRVGAAVFAHPLSLSGSKQPSLIVWKVSWLNVNCTTPLYVAWNDDLKIFPVIIYRVVFAPWPSHRSLTKSETETSTVHHIRLPWLDVISITVIIHSF